MDDIHRNSIPKCLLKLFAHVCHCLGSTFSSLVNIIKNLLVLHIYLIAAKEIVEYVWRKTTIYITALKYLYKT